MRRSTSSVPSIVSNSDLVWHWWARRMPRSFASSAARCAHWDVFVLTQGDADDIRAECLREIEIGTDPAQRLRTCVGVLRDRKVAGHHGDAEPALAQHVDVANELGARRLDAQLRGAHAQRVIATGDGNVGEFGERHRCFALGEELLANADGQAEFHG